MPLLLWPWLDRSVQCRYGQHHGFVDISTYFDWFDHAFGRENKYGAALLARGSYTADQQLAFQQQWLTAAGFDWESVQLTKETHLKQPCAHCTPTCANPHQPAPF